MSQSIGVDLGGTNIKLAVFSASGELETKQTLPTFAGFIEDVPKFVRTIRELICSLMAPDARIGLAAPGLTASSGTSIACMPGRLLGLEGFDWSAELDREVRVLNDAHAALLGEAWQGSARNLRNVMMITLGTGVGGAVMSNGQLLVGTMGRAGHLGHVCLNPDGRPDITRIPGSLEDAIGECTVLERTGFKTTKQLVTAYRAGDPLAAAAWLKSVRALGCAIASFLNVLDSEAVVVGGGIAQAGQALFEPLAGVLDEVEWRPTGHRVQILPAELGEWAGTFGAARHALNL